MDNKYITLSHLDQTVWSLVQKINQIKDSINIEETDPVFLASAASQITKGDIQKWNGLLNNPAAGITQTDLNYWNNAANEIFNNNYMVKGTDYVTAGQQSGTTLGSSATAEGESTIASGADSHAEGYCTQAIGTNAHTEGGAVKNSAGYVIVLTGKNGTYKTNASVYPWFLGRKITNDTLTTRIVNYRKYETYNEIVTKETLGTLDNYTCSIFTQYVYATGENSHAEGEGTSASAEASHAEGSTTTASGIYSHSEGYQTLANNKYSHAEGTESIASGQASHAEGEHTTASGSKSHAEGSYTIASGGYSHAEGYESVASGTSAHAENGLYASIYISLTGSELSYTTSSNLQRYYIGKNIGNFDTRITGINNQTITVNKTLGELTDKQTPIYVGTTLASGNYSHAEGHGTIASGEGAHAEGRYTLASGKYAHSGGYDTVASGNYSYTEGNYTTASGQSSHAEGYNTIASGQYQHAAGQYNIEDTNNTYAEIIGIGTGEEARANGRTLDWSGNEVLAGKLTVGAGPTENMDVATKLYVDTIITVEPMSNVQAMLTELGLDANASLTPATVPAETNHAVVQEG